MSKPISELRGIISNFHHAGLHYEQLKEWYDKYVTEVHATYSVERDLDSSRIPMKYFKDMLQRNLGEELGKHLEVRTRSYTPFQLTYELSTYLIIDKKGEL